MAKSGKWFGNLLMWFVAIVVGNIWLQLSSILAFFGLWQLCLDILHQVLMIGLPPDVDPELLSTELKGVYYE